MRIAVAGMMIILGLGLLSACGGSEDYSTSPAAGPASRPVPVQAPVLTDEKAVALMNSRCVSCHSLDRIKKWRGGEADWTARVEMCQAKSGAVSIPPIQQAGLCKWLARTYGQ